MTDELVSVVVAVFNQQDFVIETVNSVLNQTHANLEVIAVDDGSMDDSVSRLHQLKDSRLKIITATHAGESNCKNIGFNHCAGDFIGFIDGDDIWEPTKIQSHVNALKQNVSAGLAYSFTLYIDQQGEMIGRDTPHDSHDDCYPSLLKDNFLRSGSNAIHTRSSLVESGIYDPDCSILVDWDLYLRHAKRHAFQLVPEYLVRYRHHNGQNSLNVADMEKSVRRLISREFEQDQSARLTEQIRQEALDNFYSYLRKQCIRNMRTRDISISKFLESAWVLSLTQLHSHEASVKGDLQITLGALAERMAHQSNDSSSA